LGVKDPRACLFLNEWHKTLDDTGRFLFVARHWSSCIESLLHRHSKDFAHSIPNLNADNAGMKFWLKPELAATMWLSYNQRIINFVKANKNVSLIVTQRALFEGAPLIQTLNTRFGFNLDATVSSPFDADLLRDEANERIFTGLSSALQCQLNAMWSELLALATFKSDDEAPRIVKTQVDADLFDRVEQKILSLSLPHALSDQVSQDSLLNQATGLLTREQLDWLAKLKTETDSVTVQKVLDSAQAATLKDINTTDWLSELQAKFDLDANVLLAAAKLLARTKHYSDAINMFKTVVSLGVYYPYIDFMTAQCYESLALAGSKLELNTYLQKAEYFYKKALKANPNNAGFYVGYAQFLVFMDRSTEAKPLFEAAFEKSPNQPQVIIAYSRFLESIDDFNMALSIVGNLSRESDNPALKAAWLRLKLKQDAKSGKLLYVDKVKAQLEGKDLLAWLSQTCFLINAKSAETDFIKRCLGHWSDINIFNKSD
jgi:tetratricopeptide (TPR) repeat protein